MDVGHCAEPRENPNLQSSSLSLSLLILSPFYNTPLLFILNYLDYEFLHGIRALKFSQANLDLSAFVSQKYTLSFSSTTYRKK